MSESDPASGQNGSDSQSGSKNRSGSKNQRIERVIQPDEALGKRIFDHHTDIFEAVLADHPLYQGLMPEDYEPLVASPNCVFYLAWSDDELVGHLIVSNEIDDLKWLSRMYFEKTFPDEFGQAKLYYVAALGVDDGCSPKLVRGLIDALTVDIAKQGGLAVAEFRMTKSNARLPVLIAGRTNALAEASYLRLPTEQFMAFRVLGLRDEPLDLTEGVRTIREEEGWREPETVLGVRI